MAKPTQHPPQTGRQRTAGIVVHDDLGARADSPSLQRGLEHIRVRQWMAASVFGHRARKVLVEVRMQRAGDMAGQVLCAAFVRLRQIDAAIHHPTIGRAKQVLKFGDLDEFAITFHLRSCTDELPQTQYAPSKSRGPLVEKILVGLKRVVDYNVRVRVRSDGSGVETDGVKMSINPFDEIALEEALRIKERGEANEVIVMSIGSSDAQQQLRTGLAMGADRAILVETDSASDPLSSARILLEIIRREQPGLVLLGKQAIDDDNNQTGQMLAALWDRPQATFASEIVLDGSKAKVTREVDVGLESIEVDLPAVVTTDLRLNEPRYVKLPDIMKAKKKPLDQIPLADLKLEASTRINETAFAPPEERQKGIMVDDVAGLVAALQDKGLL